jgi:hypothetical protein
MIMHGGIWGGFFLCDDFSLFWNVIQSLGVGRTHEMMEKRSYNVCLIHFK